MKRILIYILILLIVVCGGLYLYKLRANVEEQNYKTAMVERGDLTQSVKASGTIQPTNKVEVGSQVSGRVIKLYVDFNSQVTKGQLIAQIDPAPYEARVSQDKAALQKSLADIEQVGVRIKLAEKELKRTRGLEEEGFASQQALDNAMSNLNVLKAQLKLARAVTEQAKAALRLSETDLDYTQIKSPVDGIVVARLVNEGQTVVASLSVQSIYLIATDLTQIQVEAAVPEADIGRVKDGQPVTFSVDSFPDESFTGTVSQVRISAMTVQNVVTYPVIILADNPDGKLYPGMTANVSIEVARHEAVLNVPNAALRFKPISKDDDKESDKDKSKEEKETKDDEVPKGPQVWIISTEGLKAVTVETGITDGSHTEITGGSLKEKQEVVVGVEEESKSGDVVNPFAPKFPGRGQRPGH